MARFLCFFLTLLPTVTAYPARNATPAPTPYQIRVSDEFLQWVTDRVRTARVPPEKAVIASAPTEEERWSFGTPRTIATEIQQYWVNTYDWRATEATLNRELRQFTMPVSDADIGQPAEETLNIHFVHHRATVRDLAPQPIPLLFLHGWPGSFLEVCEISTSIP